jgi:hypothetical protein
MADQPCVSLGHFYENHRCIYCDADFCIAEHGGHSFEHALIQPPPPTDGLSFCWHCNRRLVDLRKR